MHKIFCSDFNFIIFLHFYSSNILLIFMFFYIHVWAVVTANITIYNTRLSKTIPVKDTVNVSIFF